jgi:hypothetical protein
MAGFVGTRSLVGALPSSLDPSSDLPTSTTGVMAPTRPGMRGQSATQEDKKFRGRCPPSNQRPKCVCFVINLCRIIGAANAERWEDTFMQFAGQREISLDQDETDSVTTWILTLAIGMMVLGAVFAVLDGCDLLPPLLAAEDSHLSHVTVIKGTSDGDGAVRL